METDRNDGTAKTLFTIGYQGRSGAELMSVLKQHGVQKVIDVRATPFSRMREFSRPALKQYLEEAGLAYVHVPELGNPFRAAGDVAWRVKYAQHLVTHHEIVDAVGEWMTSLTCCLLCMEADPAQCHRTLVAEAVRKVRVEGLNTVQL